MIKKPLIFYEDGMLEIESVGKFPDRTNGKYRKQWYDTIEKYMKLLNNLERDLRHDFRPRAKPQYFQEVLEKVREKDTVSVSELWEFWYKERIEICIDTALKATRVLLKHRKISAMKRRTEEDMEFLKKIGYT